jgi:quercetin dioxygenase-like cupin family protein
MLLQLFFSFVALTRTHKSIYLQLAPFPSGINMITAQKLLYPDWKDTIVFPPQGSHPQMLLETDKLVVVLVGLRAGQKITPHNAPASVFYILEGSGWMIVNGQRLPVNKGSTVIVPDGGSRGVEAETDLAFLGAQAGKM